MEDKQFARTKIVCTIGPVSQDREVLEAMIEAGMDIARFNLAHGRDDWKREAIRTVQNKGSVSILVDLPGPKIRLGTLEGTVLLRAGQPVHFTALPIIGDSSNLPISYGNLPREIKVGNSLFINDGHIEVSITSIDEDLQGFQGRIVSGGEVTTRKGLNAPGAVILDRPPTESDLKGIDFGIAMDADWFAVSFVRDAKDVENTKKAIEGAGGDQPLVSKIEHPDAVENIDEILAVSDAVMVARGDLGIEVPPWKVPLLQKSIITHSNEMGKPVIVATQMLESMVTNPRPTRAETSDVANAILDGADAVMLSEETAIGLHPVESVRIMNNIALTMDQTSPTPRIRQLQEGIPLSDLMGNLVTWATETVKASAIIVVTRSGFTARMVSKHRPRTRILAVTRNEKIGQRTRLYWGVEPLNVEWTDNRDELLVKAVEKSVAAGLVTDTDNIVIVSGSTLHAPGGISTLEILNIQEVLNWVRRNRTRPL